MNLGRTREPIVRLAGEGREYRMPAMRAVFHAGGFETNMPDIVKWYEDNG